MQAWWRVYDDPNNLDADPRAVFSSKQDAMDFIEHISGSTLVKPVYFYESHEEENFLSIASPIWEDE